MRTLNRKGRGNQVVLTWPPFWTMWNSLACHVKLTSSAKLSSGLPKGSVLVKRVDLEKKTFSFCFYSIFPCHQSVISRCIMCLLSRGSRNRFKQEPHFPSCLFCWVTKKKKKENTTADTQQRRGKHGEQVTKASESLLSLSLSLSLPPSLLSLSLVLFPPVCLYDLPACHQSTPHSQPAVQCGI